MNGRKSWLIVAAVLTSAILVGFYAIGSSTSVNDEPSATVNTCESLPDYDFERMVSRVEQIKGMQLQRNVSLCTEQTTGGIDTTPDRGRFAHVEASGLSLFGLDATTNSQQRSSLGHATFSPSGGPIEIFLANETVVENVSWISYEGLVVHELSDAIEVPASASGDAPTNERATRPRTTDQVLARQALGNGVSMYVADLYVERYGGHLDVSALNASDRNWKHRLVRSAYYSGYRYSEETDRRAIPETALPNSTAQILHPNETIDVTGLPTRPNLPMASLEHERTDRVGELFLRETLASKDVSSERAAAAADGWANDRMDYYRANGSSVVTWRVAWQNADERAEFAETYDAVYDYERVDALDSVDCHEPGRYLVTSEETVTIVQCGERG